MIGLGINLSSNIPTNEISQLLGALRARSEYFESESCAYNTLETLQNC